jgi:hypothetical protein
MQLGLPFLPRLRFHCLPHAARTLVPAALLAALALTLQVPGAAQAGRWLTGARLQTSIGRDGNVLDSLQVSRRDTFVRLLGETQMARRPDGFISQVDLAARGLVERYSTYTVAGRRQGELRLGLGLRAPGRNASVRLEGGVKACDYPRQTSRDFKRRWLRIWGGWPVGLGGMFIPRIDAWSLDIRSTDRVDQQGTGYDLTFDQALKPWLTAEIGLEIGSVNHGIPSVVIVPDADPLYGPDRYDTYRAPHLGIRIQKRFLFRLDYSYRAQQSNSADAALGRHEVRWLVSYPLPYLLTVQFYGNLERTRYQDLGGLMILRPGEVAANADDNTVALRAARSLGNGWSIEARTSWYRNESLFVQSYYTKSVWSLGLSWDTGYLSGV